MNLLLDYRRASYSSSHVVFARVQPDKPDPRLSRSTSYHGLTG